MCDLWGHFFLFEQGGSFDEHPRPALRVVFLYLEV